MSDEQRKLLEQQLWNIANTLRGKMDADEFRDYRNLPVKTIWREGEEIVEKQTIPKEPLMVCTALLENTDGTITPLSRQFDEK